MVVRNTPETIARKLRERSHREGKCLIWDGHKTGSGYSQMMLNGQRHYIHRLAYELARGPIPAGMQVDHICGNRGCINASHLRLATLQQNAQYKQGLASNNTTGVRGVVFMDDRCSRPWRAQWREDMKTHIRYFATRDEAELFSIRQRLRVYEFKSRNDIERLVELENNLSLENAS